MNINEVLQKIKKAGYEAYLVGGYPRDTYLGKTTTDYDITTSATPEELKTIFENLDDQDSKYGRVTLDHIEITTYRVEGNYENHRSPETITYTKDLAIDLQRRDFVINTLCMDENGNYVDLLGARKDIDQRIIRTVGDANQKIEEDALRILRAIRFATTLNFQLDESLQQAIKKYKTNLKDLSYFRKKEELNRIFESENIEYGITLLKEVETELELSNLSNINPHTSVLGIWAQLECSKKYEFTKQEKKDIEKMKSLLKEDILNPFTLYQYGHYYCGIVAEIKNIPKSEVLTKYQQLPIHHQDEIAITPKELGLLVPKEMIKEVYQDLEKQILNGELENLKVFIRKYILKNYGGRKG